jgi:transporter family-2 protein
VAGAALCLLAVGISVLGEGARAASPLLLVLVVAAGFAISVQQALNGRVRRTTGDAGVATLVNFVVGTLALGLGVLAHGAVSGFDVGSWPGAGEWYLYTGGPMGASFVAVAAVVVRLLGVLRLGLAVIAGQLVGALLLDLLLPVHGAGVGLLTVLGVALTLVAVAVSGRAARP